MAKHSRKRKQIVLFIVYFLLSFFIIDSILLKYRIVFFHIFEMLLSSIFQDEQNCQSISRSQSTAQIEQNTDINHIPIEQMPQICQSIKNVSSINDIITILYNNKLPTSNITILLAHFALSTSWAKQNIFFPLGSANFINQSNNEISFRFFLPVVDQYKNADLICALPGAAKEQTSKSLKQISLSTFSLNLKVPKFGFDDELLKETEELNASDFNPQLSSGNYSRLKCHHKNNYPTRWCEFRNLGLIDRHFFFFSPAFFSFPEPFIVPGPRAPPFDKETDRLVFEPIVIQYSSRDSPAPLQEVKDFSYVYGVFHNYYMLWHVIFDFMVPLYSFIHNVLENKLHIKPMRENSIIYVRSDGVWVFEELLKIFSSKRLIIFGSSDVSSLLLHGTLGIEKLEDDPRLSRTYDDSIAFKYNFNRSTAKGMREDLLSIMSISPDEFGISAYDSEEHRTMLKPLVLLIDRGNNARNIQNIQEIQNLMIEDCNNFCFVKPVQLHAMHIRQQIQLMSAASAIVGLHGSGLANVIWMSESRKNHTTHMVEVLPYKYLCRDWYNVAANVSGVKYHMVMNKKMPTQRLKSGVPNDNQPCYKDPKRCPTLECHDYLRDQKTTVELDTFNETWMQIVDDLKSTTF